MSSRIAVIDLGTNTFHLMIVAPLENDRFELVYKERDFVKLGEEGLKNIGKAAYQRGIVCMNKFHQIIQQEGVTTVYALATEGLRSAGNGPQFIQEIWDSCSIKIQCITGDIEASLIYYGVRQAVPMEEETILVMDIGGGSVEFIVADKTNIYWKKSFPIGASVLKNKFHQVEPLRKEQKAAMKAFFEINLVEMYQVAQEYAVKTLIGASGAFDTVVDIIQAKQRKSPVSEVYYHPIALQDFSDLSFIEDCSLEERLAIEGMEARRADMIVVSYLLISNVLSHLPIERLWQTDYAIKEGIVWAVMNEQTAIFEDGGGL